MVDRSDVLVHRVGLHVFVEEVGRALAEPESPQRDAVAAVRQRGGHLECGEVPDDRPAPAPVQPEQRHEVDRRERHAGQRVDIRAVGAVEAERVHRLGEELRVDALGPTAAVLVGLDLDKRGLRRSGQPRDRPRVGVRLLELIRRAVHDELEHLLQCSIAVEVLRQRRRVVRVDHRAQRDVHVLRGHTGSVGRPERPQQRHLEELLPRRARRQQRDVPLPAVVHTRQPAVVELVADVERELHVVVGQDIRHSRDRSPASPRARAAGQHGQQPLRGGAARSGELRHLPRATPPRLLTAAPTRSSRGGPCPNACLRTGS